MLAFTFPGQGSQRPGMGRPWIEHPSWEVVEEASAVAGRDLDRLLLDADQDELILTANAQLATFVLSLVVLDAIERVGIEPTMCAGHSLGEYTALAASGALGFEEGVRLVVERGEAMHHAAEERPGTMAAVLGADDDAVEAACQRAEGEVWVANYNAPGQVVIAGTAEAVTLACAIAKELGARKVMPFPVAGAFHTILMAPARCRGCARPCPTRPSPSPRSAWWPTSTRGRMTTPDRVARSVVGPAVQPRAVAPEPGDPGRLGATRVVEVGAGGVLTGLVRRTLPDAMARARWRGPTTSTPWSTRCRRQRDLARLCRRPSGRAPLHLRARRGLARGRACSSPSPRPARARGRAAARPATAGAEGGPGGNSSVVAVGDLLGTCGDGRGPHALRRQAGGLSRPPR